MIRIVVYDKEIKIENLYDGIFFDFEDFQEATEFIKKCMDEMHPIIVQNLGEED